MSTPTVAWATPWPGKADWLRRWSSTGEALRLNPGDAELHNDLGDLLAKQGQVDEAIQHFTESLRLNAKHPEAHYNLGFGLLSRGAIPRRVPLPGGLSRESAPYGRTPKLGQALAAQRQFREASEQYRAALSKARGGGSAQPAWAACCWSRPAR